MAVADRSGLPVSVSTESATAREVRLTMSTLLRMVVPAAPQNLINDNAYDSDRLDTELRFYGIWGQCSFRRNRRNSISGWTSVEATPPTVENREAVYLVADLLAPGR